MNNYTTILFDLDGTLLDTLDDLTGAVNFAMDAEGFPRRTREDVRTFIGNGIAKLIERCAPSGTDRETLARAVALFREEYSRNYALRTTPYDGIPALLSTLQSRGYKLGLISNKYHAATTALARIYFGDTLPVVIGDRDGHPRKPAPDSLFEAMALLGSTAAECVYVGDSEPDVETAKNAGIPCIGCAWGFRGRERLLACGVPDGQIIEHPSRFFEALEAIK